MREAGGHRCLWGKGHSPPCTQEGLRGREGWCPSALSRQEGESSAQRGGCPHRGQTDIHVLGETAKGRGGATEDRGM